MNEDTDNEFDGDEEAVRKRIDAENERRRAHDRTELIYCRPRIDVLAIPNRRLVLALYQNHADHLPKQKVEHIKKMLQELYAMTPEETWKYFQDIKRKIARRRHRNALKQLLRRDYRRMKRTQQIAKAYRFIHDVLREGMLYAFYNPVTPVVSVRLRNLSDIILEQICDLLVTDIPDRDEPNQVGAFLISVADWTAIAIEQIYYRVQLKKNEELEQIKKNLAEQEKYSPQPKTETTVSQFDTQGQDRIAQDEIELHDDYYE